MHHYIFSISTKLWTCSKIIQKNLGSKWVNKKQNQDFINPYQTKVAKDPPISMRKRAALKWSPKCLCVITWAKDDGKNTESTVEIVSNVCTLFWTEMISILKSKQLAAKGTFRIKNPAQLNIFNVVASDKTKYLLIHAWRKLGAKTFYKGQFLREHLYVGLGWYSNIAQKVQKFSKTNILLISTQWSSDPPPART